MNILRVTEAEPVKFGGSMISKSDNKVDKRANHEMDRLASGISSIAFNCSDSDCNFYNWIYVEFMIYAYYTQIGIYGCDWLDNDYINRTVVKEGNKRFL